MDILLEQSQQEFQHFSRNSLRRYPKISSFSQEFLLTFSADFFKSSFRNSSRKSSRIPTVISALIHCVLFSKFCAKVILNRIQEKIDAALRRQQEGSVPEDLVLTILSRSVLYWSRLTNSKSPSFWCSLSTKKLSIVWATKICGAPWDAKEFRIKSSTSWKRSTRLLHVKSCITELWAFQFQREIYIVVRQRNVVRVSRDHTKATDFH